MPAGNPATLYIEDAERVLFTACGVCYHTVDLWYFHKDLARMNGVPGPNQKLLQAPGIEPGPERSMARTLNH